MQVARESPKPPSEHEQLSNALRTRSHLFATGDADIQRTALAAAKSLFDSAISQENQGFTRIQQFVQSLASDMARQRRETRAQATLRQHSVEPEPNLVPPPMQSMLDAANKLTPTPLSGLHIDGMEAEQIWNQLELRAKGVCELVDLVFEGEYPNDEEGEDEDGNGEEEQDEDEENEMEWDGDGDEDELMQDDDQEESSQGSDLGEHIAPLNSAPPPKTRLPVALLQSWINHQQTPEDLPAQQQPKKAKVKAKGNRHPTLDDDFFSIQEFNREIEGAEAKKTSRGRLSGKDGEDSDEEGSVDLFKQVSDDEEEEEDADADADADTTLMYGDFFDIPAGASLPPAHIQQPTLASLLALNATHPEEREKSPSPPPRPSRVRFHEEVKVKLIKSKRNPISLLEMDDDDDSEEEDVENWEDEDEEQDEDEEAQDEEGEEDEEGESTPDEDEEAFDTMEHAKEDLFDESSPPPSDLSTYAQRQIALKEQIASLEAENVADKEWTMMGEATSRNRPLNSLLEEDLDFEHRTRVAKVVTEEKVAEVEDTIKRRILEGRFDDVVRRRAFDTKPFLPSRTFELQDTKSQQSLAQIYEDEYVTTKEGGVVDDRDGKLEKEHKELEEIWEGITDKLDALCNAHFTPKRAKGVISTVSNVPSTTLESALPTAQSARSLLAPEEVYHSSSVTGAIAASKGEMTPREKQAVRMKKKRVNVKLRKGLEAGVDKYVKMKNGKKVSSTANTNGKKEGSSGGKGKKGREKAEKQEALKSVVKTGKGVTVVGKGSGGKK